MTTFVLDNSITMRWFFAAGMHPQADAVLHELMSETSEAMVPILWRYEVSAVLAREAVRKTVPVRETTDFMEHLTALPIRIDVESVGRIFSDVHRLAILHRLTSYDASYLELAQRYGLPLATLDAQLIAACQRSGVSVV